MDSPTERFLAAIDDRIRSDYKPVPASSGPGKGWSVTGAPEFEYSWEGEPPSAQDVHYLTSITRELARELEERKRALAAMRAMLFPAMDDDAVRDHLQALADGLGIDLEGDW